MTSEVFEKIVPSDKNPSWIVGILGTIAKFAGGWVLGWVLIGIVGAVIAMWEFGGFFWGQFTGYGWDGNADITLGRFGLAFISSALVVGLLGFLCRCAYLSNETNNPIYTVIIHMIFWPLAFLAAGYFVAGQGWRDNDHFTWALIILGAVLSCIGLSVLGCQLR
jgi:hypothetical protein